MKKIYRIWQDVNNGYDTYDSAIVCAESAEEACKTHPYKDDWDGKAGTYDSWVDVKDVKVKELGVAYEGLDTGVILASFNAG